MFILRALAYLFVLAGIGLAIWDLAAFLSDEFAKNFVFTSVGKLWCETHCTSLQVFEPSIVREENLNAPLLWEYFIQPWVLERPAAIVFAVFGVLLFVVIQLLRLVFVRRRRRRERRKSDLISS